MPIEREIINVYDVFEPVGPLLTYFLLRGTAPYPAGALTAPLRPLHIQNVTLISDHSLAALPFRHLAINLSGGDIYAKTAA